MRKICFKHRSTNWRMESQKLAIIDVARKLRVLSHDPCKSTLRGEYKSNLFWITLVSNWKLTQTFAAIFN